LHFKAEKTMKIAFFEVETKRTLAILGCRILLERALLALFKKSKSIKIGQVKQDILHFEAGKIMKHRIFHSVDQNLVINTKFFWFFEKSKLKPFQRYPTT